MPWNETTAMDQKVQFVSDYLRERFSMSELCDRYGVSRKTGYKWIDRYIVHGPAGLGDRTRAPHSHPNQIDPVIVKALLQMRLKHPHWGGKKLLVKVRDRHSDWELPACSTVCDILSRNGLVTKRRRRRAVGHPGKPGSAIVLPNDVWSADFKGQFKTRDGIYCYPLTVTDNFSRYLLGCQSVDSTAVECSKPVFTRIFKEYGLPWRIRTDNGVPFATSTLGRLSKLSAWWVRLGVLPEFIEPGKPQQNGKHERMHRTLKDETTKPPAANSRAQQRKFNTFRHEYNDERPHEALDMNTPSQVYQASQREMPNKIPPFEYPDRFEVRYVSANGGIRWNQQWINVSSAVVGEHVGLEEVDNGLWDVYFGVLKLGRLHERHMRIEDHLGRLARHV